MTTPYLGIAELTTSQTGKEITINNALVALEAAGNATLAVSMAAGNVTLSQTQFTRNFIFSCSGQTANRVLNIPAQVNGVNSSRLFAVRNTSGTFTATVQVTGGAGANVVVPVGECRLVNVDGAGNVYIVAMPSTASTFTVTTDTNVNRTLVLGDVGSLILRDNAAANTVTIPPNVTVAIPVGSKLLVSQYGAGQTSFVAGAGVTIRTPGNLNLRARYGAVWAIKIGTDEWILDGDLEGLSSSVTLYYRLGGFAVAAILADEVLVDDISDVAYTFPANFAGSRCTVGANPAATFIIIVQLNGATIGTISISTAGVATFATTGGTAKAVVAGDVVTVMAPSATDASIGRLRFKLKGTL